jgi:uncharacterized protein
VRLEVCGSRIPCAKLAWRCGQKDQWLKPLADTGRVGVYLRVLQAGRISPGDQALSEYASHDAMNVAAVTQVAFDTSLKTRDTLNILANHELLLRMNKVFMVMKQISQDDGLNCGKAAWKGWRDLEVFRITEEGQGVKSFYLKPVDELPLANYLPGQFLSLQLPTGKTRNWSISDFPVRDGPPYYRISIIKNANKTSSASLWMHKHCKVGIILPSRSPAGRFFLDWTQQIPFRQVYISAGIGITPMLAMMKAHTIHPKYSKTPAVWVHVTKNSDSLNFGDELSKFDDRFTRHLFFTDPLESDKRDLDYDYIGRPDAGILARILGAPYHWAPLSDKVLTLDAKMSTYHICGPTAFELSIKECLKSVGIPAPMIKSESFSQLGTVVGELKTAKVSFTKSGLCATWNQDNPKSILELAESVGLKPDYGCRVGACGSCAGKVSCGSVNGGIQMDGTILTCSAMPASDLVELEW